MASMGMLGALSGAAGGFSKVMMADMEEARATRLSTLKSEQARETNKLNNADRHANAMAQLDKGQEYSLAELAARGEQDVATAQSKSDIKQSERPQYEDILDDSGAITGQRESGTNEWSAAGATTKSNIKSPDKLVIAKQLQDWGVDPEKITNFVTGDKGEAEVKRELTLELAKDSLIDPVDVAPRVEEMMRLMYPDPAGGGGDREADIQKILEANPGRDAKWAEGYLTHLGR